MGMWINAWMGGGVSKVFFDFPYFRAWEHLRSANSKHGVKNKQLVFEKNDLPFYSI